MGKYNGLMENVTTREYQSLQKGLGDTMEAFEKAIKGKNEKLQIAFSLLLVNSILEGFDKEDKVRIIEELKKLG